jgi:hypothetical protein
VGRGGAQEKSIREEGYKDNTVGAWQSLTYGRVPSECREPVPELETKLSTMIDEECW